jgi:hypothetical protein
VKKWRGRYPDSDKELYEVAHVTFEISEEHKTFALIAGEAVSAKDRRPLFSGHITDDMWKQLVNLADRVKAINP